MIFGNTYKAIALTLPLIFASACSSNSNNNDAYQKAEEDTPQPTEFTLNFAAMSDGLEVNCDNTYSGLGPNGDYSVGIDDLRFYVSNLKFYDNDNNEITVTLDNNAFQLNHEAGSVSLIDFTGKESGFCEESTLGTPRTNMVITGTASDSAINAVGFDVGVPQALMKAMIADSANLTDAPSPLAEMVWSWASGYKHLDVNFTAMDASNTTLVSNSAIHIGSKDCGTANKALAEQDRCGLLYTPKVMLNNFDPDSNTVTIDLAPLLAGTQKSDYVTMIMGAFGDDESVCINEMRHNDTMCPIGMTFGAKCHSLKAESFCQSIFPSLGLDMETGEADSTQNTVFGMK